MRLAPAPPGYGRGDLDRTRRQIEQADAQNLKKGQDIEVGSSRVILTSPNGTRYALTVDNAGVLGTVAV